MGQNAALGTLSKAQIPDFSIAVGYERHERIVSRVFAVANVQDAG
jgi:hypothetical protein